MHAFYCARVIYVFCGLPLCITVLSYLAHISLVTAGSNTKQNDGNAVT